MMIADFSDLFPDRDISLGPFTALTLSQRTKNDMSAWSYDVEMEREELLETVRIFSPTHLSQAQGIYCNEIGTVFILKFVD